MLSDQEYGKRLFHWNRIDSDLISKALDGIDTLIQARAALYKELPPDTASEDPRAQPPWSATCSR